MKIMIEACVYNKYKDIVIAIDGDGSILHVSVSKINSQTSDVYYGDGITVDTYSIGKEADKRELQTRFIDDTYVEYYNTGKHELAQIYLKSEADKVIAELKQEIERLKKENEMTLVGVNLRSPTSDGRLV